MLSDDIRHKIFKALEENPEVSQRELASLLGVSLGKTNFCLQALMEKGWIKVQNFKNNKNKLAYTYLLTPSGIEEKAKLTVQYLRIKMQEYEVLRREIHELSKEVEDSALIIN
ncbi:MAG: MarR family EPS-associated transcriptional regulator [Leptospiraceae bacterium]|jgi:EPS-associated MarR family transcriptional regulator|nr:MarR family EPS-associated transcriptional regulator [Leptospiraceae bacterium]